MILIIRLLPVAIGLLEAIVFWEQRQYPVLYPWIVAIGVIALPFAAVAISWGRLGFRDVIEKMTPTFLLLLSVSFALLLVEGAWQYVLLLCVASVASFFSLEVLFLMAHHPSAYPVNGISRVNIGYVPLIVWYAVSTSTGLMTFLHTDRLWHLALCTMLGVLLFRTTGHPGATSRQNMVWVLIGICVGVEVGILGMMLPVSMAVQGLIAAVIFTGALRVRRYVYDPKPSVRTGWSEAVAFLIVGAVGLSTAKWF